MFILIYVSIFFSGFCFWSIPHHPTPEWPMIRIEDITSIDVPWKNMGIWITPFEKTKQNWILLKNPATRFSVSLMPEHCPSLCLRALMLTAKLAQGSKFYSQVELKSLYYLANWKSCKVSEFTGFICFPNFPSKDLFFILFFYFVLFYF